MYPFQSSSIAISFVFFTCLLPIIVAKAPTPTLSPLNYGAFTLTATYSIANQLGFFTANGLNVTYLQIPNSPAGYASLLNGQYDIITATIDNTVNFRFNSQKAITVLGQLDQGPDLVIASMESIPSIEDLKGKSIMVDNPTSGYAYLLRKILSLYGLALGTDYTFDVEGATAFRYQYLINGTTPNGTPAYATILTYPFTAEGLAVAADSRINILARVPDFVNPISSSAFTATTASTTDATKAPLLIKFLTAMLEANQYLGDIKHKSCAIDAISAQLNVSTTVATAEYAAATDPETGEVALMQGGVFNVSREGLLNVIDVRTQFGGFTGVPAGFNFAGAIIPGPGKLIDYTLRDLAVKAAASDKVKIKGKC